MKFHCFDKQLDAATYKKKGKTKDTKYKKQNKTTIVVLHLADLLKLNEINSNFFYNTASQKLSFN